MVFQADIRPEPGFVDLEGGPETDTSVEQREQFIHDSPFGGV